MKNENKEKKQNGTKKQEKTKKLIRKAAVTAIFTALAVVMKVFTNIALNLPALGIKIGFAGIFTFFPAIICGPFWGGAASALSDILGYVIAPDGAYIPWLTLTAFCGGVIKGLLWMAVTKKAGRGLRTALLCVFILIGAAGVAFHVSLSVDGFISGFAASQQALPDRGQVETMRENGKISPLSDIAVGLAKYKNDTITLTGASGEGETVLPSVYVKNSYETKITKIGSKALEGVTGSLTIPETYKTIADDALGGNTGIERIYGKEGAAAEEFAKKNGIEFVKTDGTATQSGTVSVLDETPGAFAVSNSDNYRKNLALYINLLVFGLELAGVAGVLFTAVNMVLASNGEKSDKPIEFIKIAVAVTVAGIAVTTVNTFILREFLDAWRGREFMILYIPRLIEELVVCAFHSYIISVIYGVLANGRLKQYLQKLR